jgi:hypothetical protein
MQPSHRRVPLLLIWVLPLVLLEQLLLWVVGLVLVLLPQVLPVPVLLVQQH